MRASIPVALLAALIGTGSAASAPTSVAQGAAELVGQTGPGLAISLRDSNGNRVEQLAPGTYTITVRDLSDVHNFALSGPGVNLSTSIDRVETVVWTVTFVDGIYTFVCEPHSSVMRGRFTVGAAPPPPPPPPPSPPPTSPPAATPTLVATLGPGPTVSLKRAGKAVGSLRAGPYVVVVRDRSPARSFRLAGRGLSRATGDRFTGTARWRVTFRRGVYRYWSSPGGARRMLRVR